MKVGLNTIFYGPPGTGKTHVVSQEIIPDLIEGQESADELFKIVGSFSLWEIVGIQFILNGNESLNPEEINSSDLLGIYFRTEEIEYPEEGRTSRIWQVLQQHGKHDAANRKIEPFVFKKTFEGSWQLNKEGLNYIKDEYGFEIDRIKDLLKIYVNGQNFVEFVTFHQSYSYEEFIEGIRPILNNSDSEGIQYKLEAGIFTKMCDRASQDLSNNYVIVIDEINRGNVAKVFGELITLIEEDKRIGENHALEVTLPYSKRKFGVPNNLYIVGTMNTADRSIALLDIALRRRFNFIELPPDYSLIEDIEINGLLVSNVLEKLNTKISIMLDQDHQIGHGYFMKLLDSETPEDDLKDIWYKKVMPLLQEYFYNDWARLIQLLGEYNSNSRTGFVEIMEASRIAELLGDDSEFTESVVGSIRHYSPSVLIEALKQF